MNWPTRKPVLLAICCAFAALSACSGNGGDAAGDAAKQQAEDPLAKLEIATAVAAQADNLPLASVPGVVTLPPDARVAVTASFPGAAVRVFVIEGQQVAKGQALALVRAAEPVQITGELARSRAELGLAEARAKRLGQLADEGVIARARADEAVASLRQAQAMVSENQRLAALAGAGADGTSTLRAPIAGRVAHVAIETGGPVDGMTAPFVIENPRAFQVDLQLPERLAHSVRPGMAVEVELAGESTAPPAAGSILSVAPSIDPTTRSVMAKASLSAAPGLVAGQSVTVVISGKGDASGVTVPSSAVTRIDGDDHVFVRQGKKYVPRRVRVVAEAGGRSVIAEGLKPGETVATSSVTELKAMAAE